jgi:hypothetical protein
MHDIELVGHGMLRDPDEGHLEVIEFNGPIKTGNIVIHPEETLNAEGDMFPRFAIYDVEVLLDLPNTIVMSHGHTPLFKSKKFEDAMKAWLENEIHVIKKTLKESLIKVEANIWKNIPFEYKGMGYQFLYSLSDKLELTQDFLELGIISEIYGVDHGEFKEKLR